MRTLLPLCLIIVGSYLAPSSQALVPRQSSSPLRTLLPRKDFPDSPQPVIVKSLAWPEAQLGSHAFPFPGNEIGSHSFNKAISHPQVDNSEPINDKLPPTGSHAVEGASPYSFPGLHDQSYAERVDKVDEQRDDRLRFHVEGKSGADGELFVSPHGMSGIRADHAQLLSQASINDERVNEANNGGAAFSSSSSTSFHSSEPKWTVKQTPSSYSMELLRVRGDGQHPSKPTLTTSSDDKITRKRDTNYPLPALASNHGLAQDPVYRDKFPYPQRHAQGPHPLPPSTHQGPTVDPGVIRALKPAPPVYPFGTPPERQAIRTQHPHIYYPTTHTWQTFAGHTSPLGSNFPTQGLEPGHGFQKTYPGFLYANPQTGHATAQGSRNTVPQHFALTTRSPAVSSLRSTTSPPHPPQGRYAQSFRHTTQSPVDVPYVEVIPHELTGLGPSQPSPKREESPQQTKQRLRKELGALRQIQAIYGDMRHDHDPRHSPVIPERQRFRPGPVRPILARPEVLSIPVAPSADWAGFKHFGPLPSGSFDDPAHQSKREKNQANRNSGARTLTEPTPYQYRILGINQERGKVSFKRGIVKPENSAPKVNGPDPSDQVRTKAFLSTSAESLDLPESNEVGVVAPARPRQGSKLRTQPVYDNFGYWVPSSRNPFDIVHDVEGNALDSQK